ncbi:uncharacterized protein ARMOST_15479 [Armillaria ostoyae]|uniref:Uncharacterized protein n=1 Tax=Armillaria ostoyae TaxID=47428 RepID=A0A284RTH1_ARMOS|nr:uncharacterized protein ARMOST_15479 [Armillaria ostoyae]
MDAILILRVWAMLGRKKVVLCLLSCLLLCTVGISIALSATVAKGRLGIYTWVPTLMFEIVIFLTATFQGASEMRNYRILNRAHQNFGPKPIMALILKDSVFYFVMCILLYLVTDKSLATRLRCPWLRAYHVVYEHRAITRMLLRLRKQARNDMDARRSWEIELTSFRVVRSVGEGSSESGS